MRAIEAGLLCLWIALAGKTTVPLGGCFHQFGYLLTPISESMSLRRLLDVIVGSLSKICQGG